MTAHRLVSILHFTGRSQYGLWLLLCALFCVATHATASVPVLDVGLMDANPDAPVIEAPCGDNGCCSDNDYECSY